MSARSAWAMAKYHIRSVVAGVNRRRSRQQTRRAAEYICRGSFPQRIDRRPLEVRYGFGDAHAHHMNPPLRKGFEVLNRVGLELGSLLLAEVKENFLG